MTIQRHILHFEINKSEEMNWYIYIESTHSIYWNWKAHTRWCSWWRVYSSIYTNQTSWAIKQWTSTIPRVYSSICLNYILYGTTSCSRTNLPPKSTEKRYMYQIYLKVETISDITQSFTILRLSQKYQEAF